MRRGAWVIGLVLAACGQGGSVATDPSMAAPTSAPSADALEGRTFLADELVIDGVVEPAVIGTRLRIGFDGGRVLLDGGCNSASGPYRIEGDRLVVSALGRTAMWCGEELQAQDDLLAELAGGSPTVAVEGDRLVLATADIRFEGTGREVADPDRSLVGTTWAYDGTFDSSAARFGQLRSTVVFAADGTVAVTGCRDVIGTYTLDGDSLIITLSPPTGAPCGPEETAEEDLFLAGLAGTHTLTIEAASARLVRADGSGVGLRAQP